MKRFFLAFIAAGLLYVADADGQNQGTTDRLNYEVNEFLRNYSPKDDYLPGKPQVISLDINDKAKTVSIVVNSDFAAQEFTMRDVSKIYRKLSKSLSKPYNKYKLRIITCGLSIDELTPNAHTQPSPTNGGWGNIEYKGNSWVSNESRPNKITLGLNDRHIALWASHGMFYDQKIGKWRWQRPNLFGTTEDLFTQTIVLPYLIPMLEKAGGIVFTPRERDIQKNEIIVDNDYQDNKSYYIELESGKKWENTDIKGFTWHSGTYTDGQNPFEDGTARMVRTTSKSKNVTLASYQPDFPESGSYAVYVSYQSLPNSVEDAQYIVYHKGEQTAFRVNQKMGGSTWVYLGNFDFDKGSNMYNRVVVTNNSGEKGVVTTDAVRFGGGMGNIRRGDTTSGMPRCLEGARYSAQWYGVPYSIYSTKNGTDDYGDDINVRSLMTNWLGGGSVYMPTLEGKKVPIELSLAVHSDAGYASDTDSLIGSLGICTTYFNDGRLNSGISRMLSKDFADALVSGILKDVNAEYKHWTSRGIYDRNYSETRNPEVPSAIIETMSHQNFGDMLRGQDPNFKFTIARSIYKTILRFVNRQHDRPFVVQPLTPKNFRAEITNGKEITLSWNAQADRLEPTAMPTSYNVFTAVGNGTFDNGKNIKGTSYSFKPEEGKLYHFMVTATNRGGESFPTEVLSAYIAPEATKTVLVVNGFHRLSSPAVIDDPNRQGFDMNADMGVPYRIMNGWNGRQLCFSKDKIGIEGPDGLGFCGDEMAGKYICGNTFDYVPQHADAIASTNKYNVTSCSSDAVENGNVNMSAFDCVDLILGLEKDDGHSLRFYKTFTPSMQNAITQYVNGGGSIMVSGSYVGSDMLTEKEKDFVSQTFKFDNSGTNTDSSENEIDGLGIKFNIIRDFNEKHYAAQSVDVLDAQSPAYCAMRYEDGRSAAVAYDGNDYKCITIGFPFECINNSGQRRSIMSGMLRFLMK